MPSFIDDIDVPVEVVDEPAELTASAASAGEVKVTGMIEESASTPGASVSFHLPGKHDQSSHGRKSGKSAGAKTSSSSGGDFNSRVKGAAQGSAVDKALPLNSEDAVNKEFPGYSEQTDLKRGMYQYYMNSGTSINNTLRASGPEELGYSDRQTYDAINTLMSKSSLTDDAVVYRASSNPNGMFGGRWNSDGDNTGLEWVDDGFLTTTSNKDRLNTNRTTEFSDMVEMRILVPKGTRAVSANVAGNVDGSGDQVIDRGLRYRVVRDYTRETTTVYGGRAEQRVVDVEVVQ